MSFGQHYIDTAAAKRSFYVELNKVMNWETIRQQLVENYPVGKRVRGQNTVRCCCSRCSWLANDTSYRIGSLSCMCGIRYLRGIFVG